MLVEGGPSMPECPRAAALLLLLACCLIDIQQGACVTKLSSLFATGKGEGDYVESLTSLFKDVATAVDENENFVAGIFGPEAAVEAILGLQQVIHTANTPPLFWCTFSWRYL